MVNAGLWDPKFYEKCAYKGNKLKTYVDGWNYTEELEDAIKSFVNKCNNVCRYTRKFVEKQLQLKTEFEVAVKIYNIKVICSKR